MSCSPRLAHKAPVMQAMPIPAREWASLYKKKDPNYPKHCIPVEYYDGCCCAAWEAKACVKGKIWHKKKKFATVLSRFIF